MPITIAIEPYDRHLPLIERNWTTSGTTVDIELVGNDFHLRPSQCQAMAIGQASRW